MGISTRANDMKARMTGLEPATSGVTGRCSNQLSYIPKRKQCPAWGNFDYAPTGDLSRDRGCRTVGQIASLTISLRKGKPRFPWLHGPPGI